MTKQPPTDVLSFTIEGDWGHFKKISGNMSRMTYRVPPRTTVAGLAAAILGLDRDSYYQTFSLNNAAIAVEPLSTLSTMNIPQNLLATAHENMGGKLKNGRSTAVNLIDTTENRKPRVIEYLSEPKYRIHLSLTDEETQSRLADNIESNTPVYTPALGRSECLADIEYEATQTPELVSMPEHVDSTAPNGISVKPTPGGNISIERTQADFETTQGTTGMDRRKTTDFVQYRFDMNGGRLSVNPESTTYPVYSVESSSDAEQSANVAFY